MLTTHLAFAVEPFREVYDEATPLLVEHWNEIAKNKHLMRLNPDEDIYAELADQKKLLLVTARDGEKNGKLVGYFLWFLVAHTHYKHVRVAEEDLHFLLPDYRRGMTGYQFLKAACLAALEHGAELLVMREKIGHEHAAILQRLGFVATDVIYTRVKEAH
jgi:GNAT superfamily N-acetyltransferase